MTSESPAGEVAQRPGTANDAFKQGTGRTFWIGITLSVGVHAVVFGLPRFEADERYVRAAANPMKVIETLDAFTIPRSATLPAELARPALPKLPKIVELTNLVLDVSELQLTVPIPEIPPPVAALDEEELEGYRPFLPAMVAPELKNRQQVQRELQKRYPAMLRDAGVEGHVEVVLWIDEKGQVQKHILKVSSGSDHFDRAVEEVVPLMQFRPTLWLGRAVRTVVALPITFVTG